MYEINLIKDYFYTSNYIVLCQMYLNEFLEYRNISEKDLKKYNPGHLGTSLSINFILANLNYFLNSNELTSRLIIGTGHSGVSLITNLWLNGTLEKYYSNYSTNKKGLNNLIKDFGVVIRSEINPQYPETIYDGGELGYSLGVAYGYALNTSEEVIPCIIGDGEAETGTLCSSWQLNKLLKTKSKVLPIINLNGLKMGSTSFLSNFSNDELIMYYSLLGYQVNVIDTSTEKDIFSTIENIQKTLSNTLYQESPLIIFRSSKGYTLPKVNGINFENLLSVHKNPLQEYNSKEKINIIKAFLKHYKTEIFNEKDEINLKYVKFKTISKKDKELMVNKIDIDNNDYGGIKNLEVFLSAFMSNNDFKIFSPDEIFSNKLGSLSFNTIELLNENVLQALYQGYIQAGNNGLYVSYEGFMPIITSMITQYYKYLKQKCQLDNYNSTFSMNYLLTSTCWENTYSHQNPEFVNSLLVRDDTFYSILYPKDGSSLVKCAEKALYSKNQINIIVTSKRHNKMYQEYESSNISIETLIECRNPRLILCATGDYMLDIIIKVYKTLKPDNPNIKVIYVTNPKLLDKNSKKGLSDSEFYNYFNKNVPIVYLFAGYPSIIKSLLYERNVECEILGYNDQVSICGNLENITKYNELSVLDVEEKCNTYLEKRKVLKFKEGQYE